ncbi:MAG: acyl carrier protein [bacterium]
MDIPSTIRTFIQDNFLPASKQRHLEDAASFLETGAVDSTGILEIIQFIEDTYGIAVADEELVPENLDSIANLSAFVTRKLSCGEQAKCAP